MAGHSLVVGAGEQTSGGVGVAELVVVVLLVVEVGVVVVVVDVLVLVRVVVVVAVVVVVVTVVVVESVVVDVEVVVEINVEVEAVVVEMLGPRRESVIDGYPGYIKRPLSCPGVKIDPVMVDRRRQFGATLALV